MSNKVLNNLIFSRMRKAKSKRKGMSKSMRNTMRNTMRKVKSLTKSLTKSVRKVVTKSKRKVARKVTQKVTRRAKRHTMRGGDFKEHVVDTLERIPILPENSEDLSVSVPGFGTISMKEYRQYMQDLDTRGTRQM